MHDDSPRQNAGARRLRVRREAAGFAPRLAALFVFVFAAACDPGDPEAHFELLVIGDSNAAAASGWPGRLRVAEDVRGARPLRLHLEARGGRTLFVDRGGPETFALGGVRHWIQRARPEGADPLDAIVLALGTNDLQSAFAARWPSADRMGASLDVIVEAVRSEAPGASLWLATPPPICDRPPERAVDRRWRGATARQDGLERAIEAAGRRHRIAVVNLRREFAVAPCDAVEADGVHLGSEGHAEVARLVSRALSRGAGEAH